MTEPRSERCALEGVSGMEARLAALCAAAGYPDELLELIASATVPRRGGALAFSESELGQLAEAVKVLVVAGRPAQQIPSLIAEHQARHGDRWRDEFWRETLRAAALRSGRRRV